MDQESLFGFKVWIYCMLTGTFIFCIYFFTSGSISPFTFASGFILFIFVAAIRSIPALLLYIIFLQIHYSSGFKKYSQNIYNYLMCYLLCFLTLYLFFLRKKEFPENLTEPLLWIVFLSYSIGASIAIYFLQKNNQRIAIQNLKADTTLTNTEEQIDQDIHHNEHNQEKNDL